MKKVYCTACLHFQEDSDFFEEGCSHKKLVKYKDTPREKVAILGDIKKLNKDNDCQFYKEYKEYKEEKIKNVLEKIDDEPKNESMFTKTTSFIFNKK